MKKMLRSGRLECTQQRFLHMGTDRAHRQRVVISPISDPRRDHGGHSSAPGFFDLAAVRETVPTARELSEPYAVAINAAPVKREDQEAPAVALSRAQFERLSVPVWSG
jgi:hypothetical protein